MWEGVRHRDPQTLIDYSGTVSFRYGTWSRTDTSKGSCWSSIKSPAIWVSILSSSHSKGVQIAIDDSWFYSL